MNKPTILWVNLNTSKIPTLLSKAFEPYCNVRNLSNSPLEQGIINHTSPDLICFEYDYPELESLGLMIKTKKNNPSYPVIMFTEQHSEDLAVWAFRSKLWDYIVKPVKDSQVQHIMKSLQALLDQKDLTNGHRKAIHKQSTTIPNEVRFRATPKKQSALSSVADYINNHLSEKISEKSVADQCKMSLFNFSRSFKSEFKITFQQYLTQQRINEAKRLLRNPNASVTDISFTVGFRDPSYFSRMFKRCTGLSPSCFREQLTVPNNVIEAGDKIWAPQLPDISKQPHLSLIKSKH